MLKEHLFYMWGINMKKTLIILALFLLVGCGGKSNDVKIQDSESKVANHCSLITKNSYTDLKEGEKNLLTLLDEQGSNFAVLAFSLNDGGNIVTKYDTVLKPLLKYVTIGDEKESTSSKGIGAPNYVTELVLDDGNKIVKIVFSRDGYSFYVNNQLIKMYEQGSGNYSLRSIFDDLSGGNLFSKGLNANLGGLSFYSSYLATYTNENPYYSLFSSTSELKKALDDNKFPLDEFDIYENNKKINDFSNEKGKHEIRLVSPCMAYKLKYEIK